MYAYCAITPVMFTDSTGEFPEWLNPANWSNGTKIIVGIVLIAALVVATISTGGAAGGVAGYILSGALNGAITGAVSGGLISGTISGISTGTWQGFADGFANGFLAGAVIGGITGAASNALKVAKAAKMWDKGTFKSGFRSMRHHYGKYGKSFGNIVNYTDNAVGFASRNANAMSYVPNYKGLQHAWTLNTKFYGYGWNGLYATAGKVITFGIW